MIVTELSSAAVMTVCMMIVYSLSSTAVRTLAHDDRMVLDDSIYIYNIYTHI